MPDGDGCLKILGEPAGHLSDEPVLDRTGLQGKPEQQNKPDQYQENCTGYFPESFQNKGIRGKIRQSGW